MPFKCNLHRYIVDIVAHVRTAAAVLNPLEAVAAVAAAEAARRFLRLDLMRHHRHGWADVRRVMPHPMTQPTARLQQAN